MACEALEGKLLLDAAGLDPQVPGVSRPFPVMVSGPVGPGGPGGTLGTQPSPPVMVAPPFNNDPDPTELLGPDPTPAPPSVNPGPGSFPTPDPTQPNPTLLA
ncbi:MAG: hypothetical protein C5B53_08730 [Candidatus Melainabacteria bacterium]|nr:MAG: hypothetical protein C5B53_08730 [Candidatus Melainabacteria bacterium]